MSTSDIQARFGQTLVDFSSKGAFPEEEAVSASHIEGSALPSALKGLQDAKLALESEIRKASRESAPDIDPWIAHATGLQDDIHKSRKLASEIVHQAEADEARHAAVQELENYVEFLTKETLFNGQLYAALQSVKDVNDSLDKAELLASESKILEALESLDVSRTVTGAIPAERTTRAMRLLDTRQSELRDFIHKQLIHIWKDLVHVDLDGRKFTIYKNVDANGTSLDQAIIGLKSYNEIENLAKKLWEDLDDCILGPRTDLRAGAMPSIQIDENALSIVNNETDHTVKSLFVDLELIIRFLIDNLPAEFVKSISNTMMPILSLRIKKIWLDTAVPSSLDDMIIYQNALSQVNDFATKLQILGWPGVDDLHDWVVNAPKIWLSKRRETSLDWTRNQLALGIGNHQFAERVETRVVARDEGIHMASTGNRVTTQDWDAAWESDDEKENPVDTNNLTATEEEPKASAISSTGPVAEREDDEVDAWGWGDDDSGETEAVVDEAEAVPVTARLPPSNTRTSPDIREVTLSEKYCTSSMPQPVLNIITGIYEDGAKLTRPDTENIPVAAAAAGLFGVPTLILAMYRAVSPYYYARDPSGNMYLYNDAMWLCDKLRDYASHWEQRDDLAARAHSMVKLDSEIKALWSFGRRAYTNEMITQRTVLTDLLGGAQNFLQQEGLLKRELEDGIDIVVEHIRRQAMLWQEILPYSAWASACGSLVNTVASKVINDVFDLSDLGVDEAERTAQLIAKITELDSLFIRNGEDNTTGGHLEGIPHGEEVTPIPLTAQFADKWMKLKFLSEVLQSNLKDIKFFWFESDLSLYFTTDEVVDLINLSFENNTTVRQTIKEIKERPIQREEIS